MKRLISVLLCLTLIFVLCIPAYATKEKTNYTSVFVHGMGGWGPECSINNISPYWGASTGSLSEYLTEEGYSVAEATVSPFSSAWDRACELYAQLMGTRVDYGEAHSKEHNHERYGRTYTVPLVENWNSINKINLIGHSFGGETVRLLASLMTYGDKKECKLSGNNVSPLFTGSKADWVYSVVTLDSPHNGTTLYNILNNVPYLITTVLFTVKVLDDITTRTAINKFYNTGLSQFKKEIFATGTDNVGYDLSPEGAAELNKQIKLSNNIYYFSYASVTTETKRNIQMPIKDTLFILKPTSLLMGIYQDDRFTQANDGLVNLNSALYPFNDPHIAFDKNNIHPGIWNVMPVLQGHHGTIIGMDGNTDEIHEFYLNLINMLNSL